MTVFLYTCMLISLEDMHRIYTSWITENVGQAKLVLQYQQIILKSQCFNAYLWGFTYHLKYRWCWRVAIWTAVGMFWLHRLSLTLISEEPWNRARRWVESCIVTLTCVVWNWNMSLLSHSKGYEGLRALSIKATDDFIPSVLDRPEELNVYV